MNSLKEAIEDLKNGRMVILTDDENRENEGDLVVAAESITPEILNFIFEKAKGLVCVAMSYERVEKIKLPLHPRCKNEPSDDLIPFFTYSVDLKEGISTGISAQDRAKTILKLADPNCTLEDFIYPGHVFPLQARKSCLKERSGHTEGAIELSRLSKIEPAVVICEILSQFGKAANKIEIDQFAEKYELSKISIEQIMKYECQPS